MLGSRRSLFRGFGGGDRFARLSILNLKCILAVLTAVDLYAIIFLTPGTAMYEWTRGIGRIGLPIVCFLLVEGFVKTAKRGKYALRIFLAGLVAELFWIFLWLQQRAETYTAAYESAGGDGKFGENGIKVWYDALEAKEQWNLANGIIDPLNILFTLLLCFLMLTLLNSFAKRFGDSEGRNIGTTIFYTLSSAAIIIVFVFIGLAMKMTVGTMYGVLIPAVTGICFMFRNEKGTMTVMLITTSLFCALESMVFAIAMIIGTILVYCYNGKLGYDKETRPYVRTIFYAYFPAILGILVELRYFHQIYDNFLGG